jgi:signal transduction histidine kinase
MNLAGNALKFTREGRVGISAGLEGDLLVYRVTDTGIGIAPDKLETVFAEFRQGDASITSEFGGTGLGLSITRKFVELHGGRIWVESEPEKGSTFASPFHCVWREARRHERQDHPLRRGQRAEPEDRP